MRRTLKVLSVKTVLIPRAALDDIVAHALEARPAECCGVLIGREDEIVETVRSANLSPDPNRFELDPRVHIDAVRAARDRGLRVVGFYHSHPHSAAQPSATDIAESPYADHVHLIVSVQDRRADVRLFTIARGAFDELPLSVSSGASVTKS